MHIEHIGLWTKDIEKMRIFYETYFNATSSKKYTNEKNRFSSYFLTFETGGRLELMQREDIVKQVEQEMIGFAHLALSLGNKKNVDALTKKLSNDGYLLLSPCRTTGDGYYESVIADPEGNRIELTI